jgi:hypothetical protein
MVDGNDRSGPKEEGGCEAEGIRDETRWYRTMEQERGWRSGGIDRGFGIAVKVLTRSEKGSTNTRTGCSGKLEKRGERSVLKISADPVDSVPRRAARPSRTKRQNSLADEDITGGKRSRVIGHQDGVREKGRLAPISGEESPVKGIHSEIRAKATVGNGGSGGLGKRA